MHIRIVTRTALPGGGMANPDTILDLPEAEAAPLLEAGAAEPWPPAPAPEPEGEPEPEPKGKKAEKA